MTFETVEDGAVKPNSVGCKTPEPEGARADCLRRFVLRRLVARFVVSRRLSDGGNMKKVFLFVLALVVLIGASVTIAGFMQAPNFTVERSKEIGATPEVAFAILSDFRQFVKWSPWQEIDPNVKTTFSGEDKGLNAVHEWEGNREAGKGRMTIVGVDQDRQIDMKLEFFEPFESEAKVSYVIEPAGEQAKVTWKMDGDKGGLVGQIFSMFTPFEDSVGADFDKGLSKLDTYAQAETKRLAEEQAKAIEAARAAADAPNTDVEEAGK